MKVTINSIKHPEYTSNILRWTLYEEVFKGGKDFVIKHLRKFSVREDDTDFVNRKYISYCPAHAKAAIIDIKNAIYQRMFEVSRLEGPATYQTAIQGNNGGVDLTGRTMTNFIGTICLPELLSIGKVGVFIDKFPIASGATRADIKNISPYLYYYPAKDILSWSYQDNELIALLLRDYVEEIDEEYNLTNKIIEKYRYLKLTEKGVEFQFYNSAGQIDGSKIILNLEKIPFAISNLSQSLLVDVADYQVSLLNLESSDIAYSLHSNFPFYTEQFDPRTVNIKKLMVEDDDDGDPARANVIDSGNPDVKVGVSHGRGYPKGFDRPAFIHPSAEPLQVSMLKQDKLKQDIRKLVNLSLSNLERPTGSEPSRELDTQGLEAGLSYIGLELEKLERQIAVVWADYEKSESAEIKYPEDYSLETDEGRRKKALELSKMKEGIPSELYQREVSKEIIKTTMSQKVSSENLEIMYKEVDSAIVLVTDHATIRDDHEAGLVGTETASLAAGYPKGEVDKAKQDHAERAARIAQAQSKVSDRGVTDLQNLEDSKLDKNGKPRRGSIDNE
jgi:hypothetical protein